MPFTGLTPNGGERFYSGRPNNIRWEDDTTVAGNRTIQFSTDGVTWTNISTTVSVTTNGIQTFVWTPDGALNSLTVKVRVSRTGGTLESANNFRVTPPTVTVIFPSGQNNATTGFRRSTLSNEAGSNLVNIRWDNSSTHVTNVRIEVTLNADNPTPTWNTIIASTPNTGYFVWQLFNTITTPGNYLNCRVRITSIETNDEQNFAISPNVFAIYSTTETGPDYTSGTNRDLDWAIRIEMMNRVAGEKAVRADEYILKGQISPGAGIQLDYLGETGNALSRQNVIIRTVRNIPRTARGVVTPTTAVSPAYTVAQGYYGNKLFADINPNSLPSEWPEPWLLDDGRFVITLRNPSTGNNFLVPEWEYLTASESGQPFGVIRVYYVDKGTPTSLLSKDDVLLASLTGQVASFVYSVVEVL